MHTSLYIKLNCNPRYLDNGIQALQETDWIMNFDKCTYIYTLHHFLHISLDEQWSITGHVYKLSKSVYLHEIQNRAEFPTNTKNSNTHYAHA